MQTMSDILVSIGDFISLISQSPWRGPLLSIITISALLIVKAILTRPLKAYIHQRAYKTDITLTHVILNQVGGTRKGIQLAPPQSLQWLND